MTTLEILKAADALLDSPAKWTKSGYAAVDIAGRYVDVLSEDACRFCATGAVYKVMGVSGFDDEQQYLAVPALEYLIRVVPPRPHAGKVWSIIRFNDELDTKFLDIKAAFAAAIKLASKVTP